METRREHLLVRSVEMVETATWDGYGAFNVGPGLAMQLGNLQPASTPFVQALVKASYGPESVKPRPTDGVTLHILMHPNLAPKAGEVLRLTIEAQPEGGWPDWPDGYSDPERELNEKGIKISRPGEG